MASEPVAREEYEAHKEVCGRSFVAIMTEFEGLRGEMRGGFDGLNNRLFRDNGHISLQTRLDRHERMLSAIRWVVCAVALTVIAAVIKDLVGP